MATPPTSFYEVGLNAAARAALDGDRSVDAVVVGGGYGGVAAATTFAQAGQQVLLIEKDTIGAAASGLNGGILLLSEGAHLSESDASAGVGDPLGAAAAEFVDLVDRFGIDAQLRRGTVRLANTARQARGLARLAAPATAGSGGRVFLDRHALSEYTRSDRYAGGLLEPDNLALDPRKLLEGLAQLAEGAGAQIVEHTTALGVEHLLDGTIIVRTDQGAVRAGRLVLTAGPGLRDLLPAARRRLMVGHSQIAVTEPLDPDRLATAVPSDVAFSEVITLARYFRKVAGNRLLFGISTVLSPVPDRRLSAVIGAQLADTFPQLGDVALEYAWSGQTASTPDETPWLERIGPASVVSLSNGVLASWHAGKVAARATDPHYAAYDRLTGHRHGSWPPLGMPEWLVRIGGQVFLTLRDHL